MNTLNRSSLAIPTKAILTASANRKAPVASTSAALASANWQEVRKQPSSRDKSRGSCFRLFSSFLAPVDCTPCCTKNLRTPTVLGSCGRPIGTNVFDRAWSTPDAVTGAWNPRTGAGTRGQMERNMAKGARPLCRRPSGSNNSPPTRSSNIHVRTERRPAARSIT
jgi:hypothetical protein